MTTGLANFDKLNTTPILAANLQAIAIGPPVLAFSGSGQMQLILHRTGPDELALHYLITNDRHEASLGSGTYYPTSKTRNHNQTLKEALTDWLRYTTRRTKRLTNALQNHLDPYNTWNPRDIEALLEPIGPLQ